MQASAPDVIAALSITKLHLMQTIIHGGVAWITPAGNDH
jgi:hypothetical protein